MATKAQMESTIESLTGQIVLLKEKLAQAGKEIARLRSPAPNKVKLPKTCINCGQGVSPIQVTDAGYNCPACGHNWTEAEEAAPFRQVG